MASKVLGDDFTGTADLAQTAVALATGGATAAWQAYVISTATSGLFTRSGLGATMAFPASSTVNVRRLRLTASSLSLNLGSGITTIEVSAYGGVDIKLTSSGASGTVIWLGYDGYTSSSSTARYFVDGLATADTPFASTLSYAALTVWRIEIASTEVRFYRNATLVGTVTVSIPPAALITRIDLDYSPVTALTPPFSTTSPVLKYFHLKTETTSGALGAPPAPALGALISTAGPLATPSVLSRLGAGVLAQARADSALGPVGVLANHFIRGAVSDPGPLRAPSAVARAVPLSRVAAASPLGGARVAVFHDFTAQIEAAGALGYYACNLVDGALVVRVPISSWQGTLQVDSSCYLQAVIPAVAAYADTINGLSGGAQFVIYRGARLADGATVEQEMARSIIDVAQFDHGPMRYTCTLSGYADAIIPPAVPAPATDRALTGVRSVSSGSGNMRVRCAIDWFLQPGQVAIADGVPFTASFINYYALERDSYMDVGSRGV